MIFNAFRPSLLQKDEVEDTLCSVVCVRSFPRVGQRVGQTQESLFPEYTGFSLLFLGPFPVIGRQVHKQFFAVLFGQFLVQHRKQFLLSRLSQSQPVQGQHLNQTLVAQLVPAEWIQRNNALNGNAGLSFFCWKAPGRKNSPFSPGRPAQTFAPSQILRHTAGQCSAGPPGICTD